jgi:hypothetical protein
MRLDKFRKAFIIHLVMRIQYQDGHKKHFTFRRTVFGSSFQETHSIMRLRNASCALHA